MSDNRDRERDVETGSKPVEVWETLSSEKIADCHVFNVYRNRRRSPDGLAEGDFHTITAPDWVNVLALTESGDMVMIRQYRHGTDELTWEVPGGMIDPGERPEDAARRELLEETGYQADDIQLIGSVRPNPALFNNTNYTVLARGVRQVGLQALDEHEDIHVAVYSPEQVDQMVSQGEINHALVIDALYWLRRFQR